MSIVERVGSMLNQKKQDRAGNLKATKEEKQRLEQEQLTSKQHFDDYQIEQDLRELNSVFLHDKARIQTVTNAVYEQHKSPSTYGASDDSSRDEGGSYARFGATITEMRWKEDPHKDKCLAVAVTSRGDVTVAAEVIDRNSSFINPENVRDVFYTDMQTSPNIWSNPDLDKTTNSLQRIIAEGFVRLIS